MPLQNPANYMLQLPDPAEASRKNLELGMGLVGAQQSIQQAQQRNQLFAAQQNKQAEEQSFNEAFAALSLNPTAVEVKGLLRRFPSHASTLKMEWDKLAQDERRARVGPLSRSYAAFLNGEPKIALGGLESLATAYTNDGRTKDAEGLRQIIELGKTNPGAAAALVASSLAAEGDPEKFTETFSKFTTLGDEKRKAAGDADLSVTNAGIAKETGLTKAQAEIAQSRAAAGASRASAVASMASAAESRAKISDLPEPVQKDYVAAVKGIQADRTKATELEDLAKGFEDLSKQGRWVDAGTGAWVNETFKNATGWQDKVSQLRQKYVAAVAEDIKAKQRPGDKMTDDDFKVALKGYSSENANPAVLASTIRDMKKGRVESLQLKIATAEFAQKNGSFNPAKKAFKVQGIDVQPGDTFDSVVTALAAKSGVAPTAPAPAAAAGALTADQARARIAQNNARIAALRQGGQ